jgi:hypothetical protein
MKTVYVTTDAIPRTSLQALPDGFELTYSRFTGWQLWFHSEDSDNSLKSALLAEESPARGDKGLRLETDDYVLCDSLRARNTN